MQTSSDSLQVRENSGSRRLARLAGRAALYRFAVFVFCSAASLVHANAQGIALGESFFKSAAELPRVARDDRTADELGRDWLDKGELSEPTPWQARLPLSAPFPSASDLESSALPVPATPFDMGIQYDFMDRGVRSSAYDLGGRSTRSRWGSEWKDDFIADQLHFYSAQNLQWLAGAFVLGGIAANTSLDESIRDIVKENIVDTPTDEYVQFLHDHKFLGDGYYLIPAYAAIALIGKGLGNDDVTQSIGEWSEQSLRGIVVGTPALLLTQKLTGASRPGETDHSSHWRIWSDDNGVSGHAFMGAVPFLTAARLSKNPLAKAGFYAASILPGLSRMTDDGHYPSQVFLGWALAYVATSSIGQTEASTAPVEISPMMIGNSLGLGATFRR